MTSVCANATDVDNRKLKRKGMPVISTWARFPLALLPMLLLVCGSVILENLNTWNKIISYTLNPNHVLNIAMSMS